MRRVLSCLVLLAVGFFLASAIGEPANPAIPGTAQAGAPPDGNYDRVVLVSWDGVQRDILFDLLETTDASQPCWNLGTVFPVDTGRVNGGGQTLYTCLPTLAGLKPPAAPADSPAYGRYEMIVSHTTNDGQTLTKPQHATMLSGYTPTDHGMHENTSIARMPVGATVYERLVNTYDPIGLSGRRNGFLFRTSHHASKKYIGGSIHYWAKKSKALQTVTGHGSEEKGALGPLKYVQKTFDRWRYDVDTNGHEEPRFFVFMQFKLPDITGHLNGEQSRQYRESIVLTDARLYTLMEMLRLRSWGDAAILVSTDHGFHDIHHLRNGGRDSFNTWIAAYNVHMTTDGIPLRTAADYCASHVDPAGCLANGPEEPMPTRDIVPNVYMSDITPTILDMFGVTSWRSDPRMKGHSLYVATGP